MKQIIIFSMLIIFALSSFGQQIAPGQALTKQDYLQKSKHKKTLGWLMLAGGATIVVASGAASIGAWDNTFSYLQSPQSGQPGDFSAGEVLLLTGAVAILTSIPFFIAAAKNKRKAANMSASISIQNDDMVRGYNMTHNYYPVLSVKVNFR